MDPKIHLAIDNCFAIKRWTTPGEWGAVVQRLGLRYVECVPDLENEPLLMDPAYRSEWINETNRLQQETGLDVRMLYSNNSTYDTIGLAHPDRRVRDHMIKHWFRPFMETAAKLGADVGYFVHAFPESVLADPQEYARAYGHMMDSLTQINRMAAGMGIQKVALEQMYTPSQAPFTIDGTVRVMKDIYAASGKPLYFTEDVGHHCPLYVRPTAEGIRKAFETYINSGYIGIWLGSQSAQRRFTDAAKHHVSIPDSDVAYILDDAQSYPYLFSTPRDNDCYEWLKAIGCYSPVIHLQQTDGTYSAHLPFTQKNNRSGIIEPEKLLRALKASYDAPADTELPAPCEDVYLTFELYASTRQIGYQVLYELEKSVEYWRRTIPRDGMRLSELVAGL